MGRYLTDPTTEYQVLQEIAIERREYVETIGDEVSNLYDIMKNLKISRRVFVGSIITGGLSFIPLLTLTPVGVVTLSSSVISVLVSDKIKRNLLYNMEEQEKKLNEMKKNDVERMFIDGILRDKSEDSIRAAISFEHPDVVLRERGEFISNITPPKKPDANVYLSFNDSVHIHFLIEKYKKASFLRSKEEFDLRFRNQQNKIPQPKSSGLGPAKPNNDYGYYSNRTKQ